MTVYTPTSERQAPATTHRQMWALGDYAAIAEELLAPLGPILVSTSGIRRGDRVLDVAAGSGNVSIPAAMAGAHVTASDLTPELLRRAQARAAAAGLELGWREANAEALPFSAGEFDAVLSTIGVMFAPRHQRTADELARVCRRGGKISTLNWTPEGFYGKLLSTIRPYRPTLPAGAPHEVWWGSEDYVSGLFRDHVSDIRTRRGSLTVDRFGCPDECRDYFKNFYGPAINAYRSIADSPECVATLDAEITELCREYLCDGVMQWEYLIFTARKCRASGYSVYPICSGSICTRTRLRVCRVCRALSTPMPRRRLAANSRPCSRHTRSNILMTGASAGMPAGRRTPGGRSTGPSRSAWRRSGSGSRAASSNAVTVPAGPSRAAMCTLGGRPTSVRAASSASA